MEIIYSPHFAKEYKKLPFKTKVLAERKEKVFRTNPFHVSLRTHKLKGKLAGFWAFSIDYRFRIIFEFAGENTVHFHAIGDHRIYE